MSERKVDTEPVIQQIKELIRACDGNPESFEGMLIEQLIETSLKLMSDGHDTGQLKLINRSMKEMRYAYRIFNQYKDAQCVSIFGSARTPEAHPDYEAAKIFSAGMAKLGWMCITGAANGIMKAGHEGSEKQQNFGLSIRLPFEPASHPLMDGDPKLIIFRYFFTRKLMFMSHSSAMAAFPGGFGTMDELYEMLTLMQTGKANIIPIVLIEGKDGKYWEKWEEYIEGLLKCGWISPHDRKLYHRCTTPEEGIQHIQKFYQRYHSSRYVGDQLVIRLNEPLSAKQLSILNAEFRSLIASEEIVACSAFPEEKEQTNLPRIAFHHTRKDFGLLRAMIDTINSL